MAGAGGVEDRASGGIGGEDEIDAAVAVRSIVSSTSAA
jgi:hypothetical protein